MPNPTGTFPLTYDTGTLNSTVDGFPIDTEAHFTASLRKFIALVTEGAMAGQSLVQVWAQLMSYFDAHAEADALTSAVYTGAGGSTTYHYAAIPRWPLVPGLGNGGSPRFLNFLPGIPPEGRYSPLPNPPGLVAAPPGGRSRAWRFGLKGAASNVASAAATLTSGNHITITAPAASALATAAAIVPTFDIVAYAESGLTTPLYYVGIGVAASGVVTDDGSKTGNLYKPYAHAEGIVGPTTSLPLWAPPMSLGEGGPG